MGQYPIFASPANNSPTLARISVTNWAVFFLSTAVATILFLSAMAGFKWMVFALLSIVIFFSSFIITNHYRHLLLLSSVFVLHIRLDFHLFFQQTPYAQVKGFSVTLFDLLFAVLFFYWIIQIISRQQKIRFFSTVSVPAVFLITFTALSIFHSENKLLGFCLFLYLVKGYLVFLYFANNIRNKNEVLWIFTGLVIGIVIQCLLGFMQHVTGGTLGLDVFGEGEHAVRTAAVGMRTASRVGGTIGDPNLLAMYLNFFMPLLLCFLFTKFSWKYRLIIAGVFILACFTEVITLSRGGWLALSFGLTVALYGIYKRKWKSRVKAAFVLLISVFFFVLITLILFSNVRERLTKQDYGSAYSRIPMMQVAFNIIKDKPLRGIGLNDYALKMNRYDRTRESISYRFPFPVHNAFLLLAAESGLLALMAFLSILAGICFKALPFFSMEDRSMSLFGIGFFCGVLSWIVHAQVKLDYVAMNTALWFSMGMIAALQTMLTRQKEENDKGKVIFMRRE